MGDQPIERDLPQRNARASPNESVRDFVGPLNQALVSRSLGSPYTYLSP
jgi:hypothetical protein